ncbi:GNAT family N-acetyltransferase [Actinophytocola algeriensis]|uniref:Ribosomal protein S18 acetylase RimI-like enzyme n=1 Tax=Actinophytocola algeriensis TaxID=1768010 RepID=A0A7W7VGC4_9PSEU|nr:GNAT family N-acetyltransferase [Actinophytocola algeriensis]MBB4909211.1 ribosomal protein S18 acetylase RimI-like enzyme [Actinophytocola algeriensis]MBE1474401.1 ribosomal protein S18 acetylase RimI-like enzyme [Actinophytocola algeriensis]
MELPAGYVARAPRVGDDLADARALHVLVRDYTLAVTGSADYSFDDARDELTEPGFEPARDGRFVLDAGGRLVGNAFVHRKGDGGMVNVDVVARDDVVRRWLFWWALDQVRAGADGHGAITVDHGCYRDDVPLRNTLTENGFRLATTYHRMRADHTAEVPAPAPPDGVVLRVAGDDDGLRRSAHHVLMSAFTDHFGFADQPYDEWLEHHERRPVFAWSQLWVAELDGRPVGVLECDDRFAADERCGCVAEVGVVAAARGRGIASFLLRHAFATDAAAGLAGTLLHVDTDNVTPALRLYESVGMRPVLVIDAWRAVVTPG